MNQSNTGNHAWSAKRPLIIGLIGVLILLGGFGTWSVATSIAGAIVASGRIEVDRNRQVVQHLDGGIVEEILVDEGDTVVEGAVLLRLDARELRSQLVITEGQLFELMARRGRLDAQRDSADTVEFDPELHQLAETQVEVADLMQGQVRLFQARKDSVAREIDQLEKRRSQIKDQISGVQAQQASRRTQLELISEELENQQSLLDRGLAQAGTVLNLRRTEADLQGSLGELVATEAQADGRITEIDIEILKLGTQQREEAITRLRDLRYQELELAETRRALLDRLARLDITAPVSGVVYGLQVHTPRSVVRAAEPVLYLVPQDRPLIIAAQVAPTDVDQIFVGQPVTLRFPALDQRATPELFGTVKQVSADAFEDEASKLSYYRTEIELDPGQLDTLPEDTVLIPGMPVEGYIRTADRTPLAYLVKPLSDYFVRAFRES
ncbi:HlyD family type I secretion periplasmic adaptor subunit [Phaeobacter sp. C3_T13_0]|uniref:HlyD family type I secretion periplasmic adaptor subunit n=1 Tax=Phaeobacter cretensis TaxID=3342641 RepID=UPI0039BC50BB